MVTRGRSLRLLQTVVVDPVVPPEEVLEEDVVVLDIVVMDVREGEGVAEMLLLLGQWMITTMMVVITTATNAPIAIQPFVDTISTSSRRDNPLAGLRPRNPRNPRNPLLVALRMIPLPL